jgi:hypothetical protein
MCEALARTRNELRQQTEYSRDDDFGFASPTLDGKRPLWGQTMNAKVVKPAAIALAAGGGRRVFGWHRFRHSLSTWTNEGQSDDAAPSQTRYHGNLHARELWEGVDAQRMYIFKGHLKTGHGATAADEARLEVNLMKSSIHRVGHRAGNLVSGTTIAFQMVESSED